jgi:cardiolipin synthase
LVWLSIAANSSQNINKLPWLIVLALEPFVGLALFLSFGRSFDRSRRYRLLPFLKPKEYLLKEQKVDMSEKQFTDIDSEITDIFKAGYNLTGHVPYLNTTNVTVLTNGEKTFPTLLEEIEKATAFICMQYYIIRTDKIGSTVLNKLKEKASNGIEVFLQFDAFGSIFLNKKMIKQLKESGVKIVKNDPVYFGLFNTKVNFRNHRKVIVIDGKVGFLGGLNLADEYNQGKPKKYGIFRDTHLKIEGEAVRSLTQLFFRDWGYNTETLITDDKYYPDYKTDGLGLVQILPSGPEFKHPPIRNVYVKMINNAKQSIKIMTPYIALDHELLTSLVIASNSGVEVSIILPGIPDKKSIYTVSKSFIEDLLEEGINVYFYTPGFCHAKVFIIDDMIASCGSYNLDNRSAKINFEVTALLYSQGVKKLVNDFNNDLFNSKQIQLKKWNKRGIVNRVYEGIMNLFSPLV